MKYKSRVVHVGKLAIGGETPVVLQSMTNTSTLDTEATVAQSIRMIEAGCQMVRITAQGPREASHLQLIKESMAASGYDVPLIADIHYSPAAAEIAAGIVEKVRINPGNYVDSNKVDYTSEEYDAELVQIEIRLMPLLDICKKHNTAIRIGVNHGSLSKRIVSRYGDTPAGMVQSALEFTRICHKNGFNNLILSMKSSNVRVMVEAYCLLAEKLTAEGLNYPLHLGVTEAGEGDEGRIKSIAGIGALLARGIGDTIRVSLTEEPEAELPVAADIISRFHSIDDKGNVIRKVRDDLSDSGEMLAYRETAEILGVGGKNPVAVVVQQNHEFFLAAEDFQLSPLPLFNHTSDAEEPSVYLAREEEYFSGTTQFCVFLKKHPQLLLIAEGGTSSLRKLSHAMSENGITNPLILKGKIHTPEKAEAIIEYSLNPGNLLIDGAGNGICIDAKEMGKSEAASLGFKLLQASRRRISRTEFISCPSCGRTLFNIQETLQEVKSRTSHLKGLKIAVMGCIVNGPGEMADADYGYVGAGNGKVTLYKGKTPVKRGVAQENAVEELIGLIQENGDWFDK